MVRLSRFGQRVDPIQQPASVVDESFGPNTGNTRYQVINEDDRQRISRMSLGRHGEEFLAQSFDLREVQTRRLVHDPAGVLVRR